MIDLPGDVGPCDALLIDLRVNAAFAHGAGKEAKTDFPNFQLKLKMNGRRKRQEPQLARREPRGSDDVRYTFGHCAEQNR
jgi:hypothetical protein